MKRLLSFSLLFSLIPFVISAQSTEPDFFFDLPDDHGTEISSQNLAFHKDVVVSGLEKPWAVTFLPDGRALITEIGGTLRMVENGKLSEEPIKGIPDVYRRGQGGLLDIVLDPNYEENGWIYISYSIPKDGGGNTAIIRGKLDGNALVNQETLFVGSPFTQSRVHFGSRIVFDDSGHLYFSIGDRGTMSNAQTLENASGKVHRINLDGTIPDDNPYVDNEDAVKSIYNHGHRNPQGMVTHPESGEIWTHEHGPKGGDEINIEQKGVNYGWPEVTFGVNYDGTIITEDTAGVGFTQPIHYWVPSIAPSGMDFVTNSRYESWEGDLFVGSLKFARVHRLTFNDDNKVVNEEILLQGDSGRVRDVYMAPDGYLYILDESAGELYRLLPKE